MITLDKNQDDWKRFGGNDKDDNDDDYTGCCERNAGFEVEPVCLTKSAVVSVIKIPLRFDHQSDH